MFGFHTLFYHVREFQVFGPDRLRWWEVEAKLSNLLFEKLKTRNVITRHKNFQILIRETGYIFIM